MKESNIRIVITNFSNFGYIAACVVLYLIALCILVSSVWGLFKILHRAPIRYTNFSMKWG